MAEKKKSNKFLDKFILMLIVGCVLLILIHQTINVVTYLTPEPTPTRVSGGSSKYFGEEIKDEDILDPIETPTHVPTGQNNGNN